MIAQDGGRDGSKPMLDGPSSGRFSDGRPASAPAVRTTRRAARGDASDGETRQTERGPHQPFTATVPCDPVPGLSPHDGPATEPRRIESPALPLCEGAPTAEPASAGSTCPGDRLRTWPPPTARPATGPCRPKRPMTAAPPPERAMSRETNSDLRQPTPTLGEARCVFVV